MSTFQLDKNIEKSYNLKINKGDELGAFRMGSTIVMLYAKGVLPNEDVDKFLGKSETEVDRDSPAWSVFPKANQGQPRRQHLWDSARQHKYG